MMRSGPFATSFDVSFDASFEAFSDLAFFVDSDFLYPPCCCGQNGELFDQDLYGYQYRCWACAVPAKCRLIPSAVAKSQINFRRLMSPPDAMALVTIIMEAPDTVRLGPEVAKG